MTSFLTGGLGGLNQGSGNSRSAQALREIDSRKVSYANKDFVRNIAWLNQSVDTLSQYTQKLEAGVSQANMNALEQISAIWGDLFILFAGLEPTGVDIGDVKYIIQGIGAFFGINPSTPFPLNLLEAAEHMLTTYLIPLPQFTDVIFDAIIAWSEDFGLSEEFVSSLTELRDAIEELGASFGDLFQALKELLGAFGFLNFTSTSGLGELWDTVMDFIGGIGNLQILKPVLELLSSLGVPFIHALTAIINGGSTFLGFISGDQVRQLGDNITPAPSADTQVWSVGGSSSTAWIYDELTSAPGSAAGSFTTLGTGVAKRLTTQNTFKCSPGSKLMVGGKLRWSGIPTTTNDFGVVLVWFNGATEVSTTSVNIAGGHGATGGFSALAAQEITVPQNVDGFRIGARVGATVTSGQVWVDDITVQRSGTIPQNLISGLTEALEDFLSFEWFTDLVGSPDPGDIFDWFSDLLNLQSPIPALNLFGDVPEWLFNFIPVGAIGAGAPNLLENPGFDTQVSLDGEGIWTWDGTVGRGTPLGSAKTVCGGTYRELLSNTVIKLDPNQKLDISAWVSWNGLAGNTTNPIVIGVTSYTYDRGQALYGQTDIASAGSAGASSGFVKISGTYTTQPGVKSVRVRLAVKATATAGNVWYDDLYAGKPSKLSWNLVDQLEESWQALLDIGSGLDDGLGNLEKFGQRLWGLATDGTFDASQLFNIESIPLIPALNVIGVGAANMFETIQNTFERLWAGLARSSNSSGKSLADVANQASNTSETADTALQVGEWNNAILGLRNNKSLMEGMDESEESNFLLSDLLQGTAPPIVPVTASSSAMAVWRATETAKKGFISWYGRGVTNIGSIVIDIYRFNYEMERIDLIYTSPDVSGQMTSSWGLGIHYLPEASRFDVNAGDVIGVAFRVTGTGTFEMAGKLGSWLPGHPTVIPKKPALKLPAGGPFPGASFASMNSYWSGDTFWFGIGIVSGDVPPPYNAPRTMTFSYTGANQTFFIPTWATHLDVIMCSPGGGGHGGSGAVGAAGEGGRKGTWVAETLVRGVDFPVDATTLTLYVGGGGYGGGRESNGGNGETSFRAAIPSGKAQLAVVGGNGGNTYASSGSGGQDADDFTYMGTTYAGGNGGSAGKPGNPGGGPGGGGGGGEGGIYGLAWAGARGGDGRTVVVARQVI